MACWRPCAPLPSAPCQPDSAAHPAARWHAAGLSALLQPSPALHASHVHQHQHHHSRTLRTAAIADRDGRRPGSSGDGRPRQGPAVPQLPTVGGGGQSLNGSTASAAFGRRRSGESQPSSSNGAGQPGSDPLLPADQQHQEFDSGWDHAWGDIDDDWDEWGGADGRRGASAGPDPPPARLRRFSRAESRRGPRDAYLRPMIDREGIRQRLTLRADEGEEALRSEFDINQLESRAAVRFTGILLGVPLLAGFIVSRIIAHPLFVFVEAKAPMAFAPTDAQKIEGARKVHEEELRLSMDVAIGRAPPLTDGQLQGALRHEAHELLDEFREHNKQCLLNVVADSTSGVLGFVILAKDSEGRGQLFRTVGRIFGGFSDTAKAFVIIASTDILLGYHSEEGWTAFIRILLGHYGAEVEEDTSHVFVAIVPVVLDSFFKYWIFVGLNRQDPAATVTLKSMDRH